MKSSLCFVLCVLGIGLKAQEALPPSAKAFNMQVKVYPSDLLTGLKGEVAFGLRNNWQLSAMGTYYYRQFYFFRRAKSMLPSVFYQPTDGFGAFLSIERTLSNQGVLRLGDTTNQYFSVGLRMGTKQYSSVEFDVTPFEQLMPDNGPDFVQLSSEHYYLLFITRLRSAQKGVFIEVLAQAGVVYWQRREASRGIYTPLEETDVRAFSLISPHISFGLNLGFGW